MPLIRIGYAVSTRRAFLGPDVVSAVMVSASLDFAIVAGSRDPASDIFFTRAAALSRVTFNGWGRVTHNGG